MDKYGLTEVLKNLEKGAALEKMDRELMELVMAVQENHKKGKLTITLDVCPIESGQVFIIPESTVKKPKAPKVNTLFFVGREGELSRNDIRQMDLFPDEDAGSENVITNIKEAK